MLWLLTTMQNVQPVSWNVEAVRRINEHSEVRRACYTISQITKERDKNEQEMFDHSGRIKLHTSKHAPQLSKPPVIRSWWTVLALRSAWGGIARCATLPLDGLLGISV